MLSLSEGQLGSFAGGQVSVVPASKATRGRFISYPRAGDSQKAGWAVRLVNSARKLKGKSSTGHVWWTTTSMLRAHLGGNNL